MGSRTTTPPTAIGTSGLTHNKRLFPRKKRKKKRRFPCLNAGTTDGTFPGRVKPVSHVRPRKTRCWGGGGDWIHILYIPFKPDLLDFFKVCSWFLYFFCLPLCSFVARRQIFLITLQLNRKLMLKIDQKHFRLELGKMVVQGFDVSKICLF